MRVRGLTSDLPSVKFQLRKISRFHTNNPDEKYRIFHEIARHQSEDSLYLKPEILALFQSRDNFIKKPIKQSLVIRSDATTLKNPDAWVASFLSRNLPFACIQKAQRKMNKFYLPKIEHISSLLILIRQILESYRNKTCSCSKSN